MRYYHNLIISILLLLAGCVSPSKPPADVELQSSEQFNARSLDNPGLRKFIETAAGTPVASWPLRQWHFNQLNLAAFYYHPDLNIARAQWQTVKAGEITAGQIPNPSGGPGITYDETMPYRWLVPFNFSIPIETANKRELRVENAQDQSKAAEHRIISAAWAVRNRLANALIDYYAASESIALYRKQEAAQKPIVDIFEQRSASGQTLSLNASQLLVAYRQTLLAEKETEKQQAEAKANFAAALGVPVNAVASTRIAWDDLVTGSDAAFTGKARETALKNNSQLMAALADYVAAHSALQLELAKRIPDVNIGTGYTWSKNGDIFTLGLSITIPIFNNNEGPIAEAVAKRKETAERFNALQAKIISNIELVQASYKATLAKRKTADQLLAAQQAKAERLSTQLDGGEVSKLPSLLAQSEIQTAAIARLEAQTQLLKAKAALEYALEQPLFGTGIDTSIVKGQP